MKKTNRKQSRAKKEEMKKARNIALQQKRKMIGVDLLQTSISGWKSF